MRYYVYILRSRAKEDKTYIGYTTNLKQRISRHNAGLVKSTRNYRPWTIETYITFGNRLLAIRFERYLKSASGIAFRRKRLVPKFLFNR